MSNKTLYLSLKKKWFDMIDSGEKKEEYREPKPYWCARLLLYDGKKRSQKFWQNYIDIHGPLGVPSMFNSHISAIPYEKVEAKNGYGKLSPCMQWNHVALIIGKPDPEWCEPEDREKTLFILSIGEITGHGNGKFPF